MRRGRAPPPPTRRSDAREPGESPECGRYRRRGRSPPHPPVRPALRRRGRGTPTVSTSRSRAARAAASRFGLSPLVLCRTSRSSGRQSASTCRAKTCSNIRSFAAAVSSEESVVRAMAASGAAGRGVAHHVFRGDVLRVGRTAAVAAEDRAARPAGRSPRSAARQRPPGRSAPGCRAPSATAPRDRHARLTRVIRSPPAVAGASASRSAGSRPVARRSAAASFRIACGLTTVSSSACEAPPGPRRTGGRSRCCGRRHGCRPPGCRPDRRRRAPAPAGRATGWKGASSHPPACTAPSSRHRATASGVQQV